MMRGYAYDSAPFIWLHVHWIFWGMFIFGVIAALVWLIKYGDEKLLQKVMWSTLVLGLLGGLLTAPMALLGFEQMWSGSGMHGSWSSDDWFDEDHYEFMQEHWDEMEEYWDELEADTDADEGEDAVEDEDTDEEDFYDEMEERMDEMMNIE
jgi:hypothetical protein